MWSCSHAIVRLQRDGPWVGTAGCTSTIFNAQWGATITGSISAINVVIFPGEVGISGQKARRCVITTPQVVTLTSANRTTHCVCPCQLARTAAVMCGGLGCTTRSPPQICSAAALTAVKDGAARGVQFVALLLLLLPGAASGEEALNASQPLLV